MKKSFLQQLHDTRVSRATDPRDKVYALAGILLPEDRFILEPNYGKTVAEIYAEVAVKIIQHQSSLRILSATQPINGKQCPKYKETSGSWVPNWSKESLLTSLGLSNLYLEPYDAGGSIALTKFETREGMDILDLKCYGITLDVIQKTGNVCPIEKSGESIARVLNEWNNLVSLAKGGCFKPTSRLGKGIFFVGEHFFLVDPASDILWPTMRAQPSTTLELTPDGHAKREACPVTIDGLKFCLGCRFLMTKSGLIGLAPPLAVPGDIIVVLLGAPVPHVLRRKDSYYTLVGECYVHGVMGGEALAHLDQEIALQVPGHRVRRFLKSRSAASLEWFLIR
ncbi:hypothetical protein BKA66DRAFT_567177 [Pyrenochaeta sp. MPI-SDFR-AT-0127]|nr:hypothetical protein BKA66DRAFT_567177 [Pyrenochaeta sp. MPI-SDFR-AT-0127]